MLRSTIAWLAVGLSIADLNAQQYDLRVFGLQDGLPSASVHAFAEDASGFLWLGTSGGACRTDGRSFLIHDRHDGLPDDRVSCLLAGPKGAMLIGTRTGAVRLGAEGTARFGPPVTFDSEITGLLCGGDGMYWLCTADRGSYRSPDGTTWEPVQELAGSRVLTATTGPRGTLWFGTEEGVWILDDGRWRVLDRIGQRPLRSVMAIAADSTLTALGTAQGAWLMTPRDTVLADTTNILPTSTVRALLHDGQGGIWIGTPAGLVYLQDGMAGMGSPRRITEANGLGHNDVRALHQDRSGAVWIGTAFGGACKFVGLAFIHFTDRDGLRSRIVSAVRRAADGSLWLGTYGGGLAHYDGRTLDLFGPREGLSDPFVLSIATDVEGHVIVGTAHEGVFVREGTRFRNYDRGSVRERRVNMLVFDDEGRTWAATREGLFCDPGDHVVMRVGDATPVNAVLAGGDSVWVGTLKGLHVVDTRRIPWMLMPVPGVPPHTVTSLARDALGGLWIGTEGHGLMHLRGSTLSTIGRADGLGSDHVELVQLDAYDNVWVGTRAGLDLLELDPLQEMVLGVEHYGPEEGFAGVETFRNASMLDPRDSTLWFGTVKGLTRYDPHLVLNDPNEPRTRITGLELFHQRVDWTPWCDSLDADGLPAGLVLPHDKDQLTFSFVGISLAYPEKVRYQYILEGRDPDWSPIGPQDQVTYSGLGPGTYTFKVIARNPSGVWNQEPTTFSFTIEPPLWRTTPFLTGAGVALLLLLWGIIRLRERNLRRDRERLEKVVQERTRELASEKDRSERLLLNILPERTAMELREHGVAEAHSYAHCSVLFSDFQGFTLHSAQMQNTHLVSDLDRYFRAFDRLTDRYGTEKIKTIGDAYMCAAGVPDETASHPLDAVLMALGMLAETDRINAERAAKGQAPWPIRIGIHSGPLIAGVVGEKKFAFDIWGDTVNLASRMESNSEAGRINISGATHALIGTYVEVTPRGSLDVKNKGAMQMYFVDRLKPEYSEDVAGRMPNDHLMSIRLRLIQGP